MQNEDFEELNMLLTIWIIASNDENHIITYKGLSARLGTSDILKIKNLVHKHRELFRITGGTRLLNEWKAQMLSNSKLPGWIAAIDSLDEREKVISSLTADDIFRSQFRCEDRKRSSIELIDWGVKHIDRLREIKANLHESRYKWITSYGLPILTSCIGLISLIASLFIQSKTVSNQSNIQKAQIYQAELKPKLERYATIIASLDKEFMAASEHDEARIDSIQYQIKLDILNLEPFLDYQSKKSNGNVLNNILERLYKMTKRISRLEKADINYKQTQLEFARLNGEFQYSLRSALFAGVRAQ